MATPADTPIQQRYTAGQYVLDVTAQPLALSRWYPQPLVQELQFQLWLQNNQTQNEAPAEPTLIAEGDRPTLQAISQYVSEQVKTTLVTTHLSASASGTGNAAAAQEASAPQPIAAALQPTALQPTALQLTQPLSYIQLCDLSSVLHQCGQSIRTVPVAIPIAQANTPTIETKPEHPPEKNNLISLAEARRSQSHTHSHKRHAYQRRNRAKLWASSAAAALFAVGLASTLRPYDQFSPQSDQQSEQGTAVTSPERANTANESALPDIAARDRSSETESDRQQKQSPQPEARNNQATPIQPPTGLDSALPGNAPAIRPSGISSSEKSPGNRIAGASEQAGASQQAGASEGFDAATSRAAIPSETSARIEELATASESASNQARSNIAVAPAAPTPAAAPTAPAPATTPDIAVLSDTLPTENNRAERPSADIDAETTLQSERTSAVEEATADTRLNSLEVETIAPSSDNISRAAREQPTELLRAGSSLPSNNERLLQIQNYFQNRWQQNGTELDARLRYDLQLSATGEVVSFAALDENAQTYRDRLLPGDMPLRFSASDNGLRLQLEILPNGQVLVKEY
ncbi:MAG: hypothetical protein AB8B99_12135 [Phormidesmis sp.]